MFRRAARLIGAVIRVRDFDDPGMATPLAPGADADTANDGGITASPDAAALADLAARAANDSDICARGCGMAFVAMG